MQDYEKLPFDLAAAVDGAQLVTTGGLMARVVDNSRKADDGRNLVVLVKYQNGEVVRSYREDGTCNTPSKTLHMYRRITGGWINIYVGRKADPTIYGTKTKALENAVHDCVATVHVKWPDKE